MEPNYTKLKTIADQCEREKPLSPARFTMLAAQAEKAAGDQQQLVEFMVAYMPDELMPAPDMTEDTEETA